MTDLRKIVGWFNGEFTDKTTGEVISYHHLFVVFPRDNATGMGSECIKVSSNRNPFDGLELGDYIECRYNKYGKCTSVVPVAPSDEDIKEFSFIDEHIVFWCFNILNILFYF